MCQNAPNAIDPNINPSPPIASNRPLFSSRASGRRGGRAIRSGALGSAANANAGTPSVTRFIQRIWIGRSGSGRPSSVANSIINTSLTLHDNRKWTVFRILSNTPRPSSTAALGLLPGESALGICPKEYRQLVWRELPDVGRRVLQQLSHD